MFFEQNNIARFRAKQVYEWLWKKRALSFDEMTSLSISDRSLLNKHFAINSVSIHKMEQSNDNTIKYSLKLYDNKLVEGVLIPSRKINRLHFFSGRCSLACTFVQPELLN